MEKQSLPVRLQAVAHAVILPTIRGRYASSESEASQDPRDNNAESDGDDNDDDRFREWPDANQRPCVLLVIVFVVRGLVAHAVILADSSVWHGS